MVWLCVIAIALGIGRWFVPTHGLSWAGTYEAFAHLFVGGLLGAWMKGLPDLFDQRDGDWAVAMFDPLFGLVLVLSAVEVAAFLFK